MVRSCRAHREQKELRVCNAFRDNMGRGVDVGENSALRVFVETVTVTGNATGGVSVSRTSFVGFQAAAGEVIAVQISGNTGNGVDINDNSSARLASGVEIHDNMGMGISLLNGSSANLSNVPILNHANGPGLQIHWGSSVLANDVTVMNNGNPNTFSPGIYVAAKSALNLSNATVRSNGREGGIQVFDGATVNLNNVQILDHANGCGLNINLASNVFAGDVTVMNNGSPMCSAGITLNHNSSIQFSGNSTVSWQSGHGDQPV